MPAPHRHIAAACAAGLLVGAAGGCSTGHATAARQAETTTTQLAAWPELSDAYARLAALRDAERPSPTALPVPQLRALDTDALAPMSPDHPAAADARRPLPEVLAALRAPRATGGTTPPPPPPSEGALLRARQLYSSGLARLLDRDAAGAARDLAGAAQLDPTSPAPWLKLAEAQSIMGQAGAAMLSRRKAADLGSDDPLTLGVLGIQAARTGQHDLAAHYLARCLDAEPQRADPLLRQVALVRLSDPLTQLGYLQASIDALHEGLVLPRQLRAPTRFADEATDIARRASDLWVRIGDTACRLGDDSLAAEAYATAAGAPSVDPGAILTRRAFVLLRAGRTASVALLALDDIAGRQGRADSRDLALLAMLRDDREVAPLVVRALGDLDRSITDGRTATTNTLLTLAKAAASPPDQARSLLRDRALAAPGDPRVLAELFARCDSPEAIEAAALRLLEQSPADAATIAKVLAAWHPAPGPLSRSLPDTPAGRALRAALLLALGRPADAFAPSAGADPAPAELLALAAAQAGAWEELDALVRTLDGDPVAQARALKSAQRYEESLAALGPALAEPGASIGTLLLGAELALNNADPALAAELLDRAVALDEFDERVYEGLINVRQAAGEPQGAGEAIRALRERAPSSQLLRWVNTQEEARRGLIDQAERSARALVEDSPLSAAGALGLLMQVWAQRNAVEDRASLLSAASWLESLCAAPPVTGEMLAARATLLQLLGRSDEAELVARDAYAARPTPPVSRALENLLRATGRPDEADALAESRFAGAGSGIDASLDRAEHHARLEQWEDAVSAAQAAMPRQARLTPEQEHRVLQLAAALAGRAQGEPTPALNGATLALLTAAETRGIELDWQLGYARWALLADSPDATTDQIAAATVSFLQKVATPEVAARIIGDIAARLEIPVDTLDLARSQIAYQLAGSLLNSGKEDAALEVYRVALRYNPDHAWAANDLGYFLTERHELLDEAERLLEHAYALKPDQSNIADSLGWLRYKLGRLDNEPQPDGSVREGAVSLLIAATGLPGGADSATVHDHLGDALWRTGDRERAEAEWLRAQQLLVGELAALRDGGSSPRRDDLTAEAASVGAKLDALQAGAEPPVAPRFSENSPG
jgi:Tfp pilus assembly protein PilF